MKEFIYETKNSLSWIIFRGDHFWDIWSPQFLCFAGIPGIKLGLTNLAVLFILDRYSARRGPSCVRCQDTCDWVYVWKSVSVFYIVWLSAALSLTVMNLLKKHSGFSLIGISVAE